MLDGIEAVTVGRVHRGPPRDPACYLLFIVDCLLFMVYSIFYILKGVPYHHTVFHTGAPYRRILAANTYDV